MKRSKGMKRKKKNEKMEKNEKTEKKNTSEQLSNKEGDIFFLNNFCSILSFRIQKKKI